MLTPDKVLLPSRELNLVSYFIISFPIDFINSSYSNVLGARPFIFWLVPLSMSKIKFYIC